MITIDELRAKRKSAAQRDYDSFFRRGISGKWNTDGTLVASDTPGTLWVRLGAIDLNDKRPATRVLNSEVPSKTNIPVILWNLDGEWDVFCLDSRRAKQLYGSAIGNYAIPDLAGDLLQFTVPGRNLKPGRVGLWKDETGKLLVNIGRFDYIDTAGSKKTWNPSDANRLDIFGNRPAAVGGQNQQRWVRFALNPDATTPALVAINGTAQSTLLPLISDAYNSIAVPTGYVLLDAVILKTGDTFSLVTEERWEFGRLLYAKEGGGIIPPVFLDGVTDAVQLTVQAHSTQTAQVFVVEDSAGNDQFTVNGNGAVVINEEGNDADTRVETDTDANALFVDGGSNNVGIGTGTPDASAKLELLSTTKGFLTPRMTTTQRDAISSPATGLVIFNTTTGHFEFYSGSAWIQLITLTLSETLTNKTLTTPTIADFTNANHDHLDADDGGTLTIAAISDFKDGAAREIIKVRNTSGATANAKEVGYLDPATGDYKTTITATFDTSKPCVVHTGGANNADIYVQVSGRCILKYTGTDLSAGNYVVFSTTAGKGQQQTSIQQEVIGIVPVGASIDTGADEAEILLLHNEDFVVSSATNLYRFANASTTDFVATINGTPSGTSVVYNAPSSGAEDVLVPSGTTLAKMILYNTTRGNSAQISSVNTGTNTITLTATVPGDWASGDSITVRSQTNTDAIGAARFIDFALDDTSVIPPNAFLIKLAWALVNDSGGAGTVRKHPFTAGVANLRQNILAPTTTGIASGVYELAFFSRKFELEWDGTGTGTMNGILRVVGYRAKVV